MQPETLDAPSEASPDTQAYDNSASSQNGFRQHERPALPLHAPFDEHGGNQASGSEWSLSTSPGRSPSESHDAWLDSEETAALDSDSLEDTRNEFQSISMPLGVSAIVTSKKKLKNPTIQSPLRRFPEEMLFHVISYLSAADLLTVKLVSRRFNDLVNSPHAWINAFSRYFPGSDALARTADTSGTENDVVDLRSDKRAFTRLGATASWTSEFLLRTKLLRCLVRGKPALPFASPSPGKPTKGFATFTFTSRLRFGISHLHANFGAVLDKRLPQFIHGLNREGTVTSSDKRGKANGWGLTDPISFQDFAELHPGSAEWGLGYGDVVGLPNVMDVSSTNGMVYGEGTPGGYVYYLSTGESHGRYLAPFLNVARHTDGVPRISQDMHSVCSVWIAKTPAVPRMTSGLVGLLCGSSSGVISSFSTGLISDHQQRFGRGELTARWVLSPGVPIIAIMADDHYSEERAVERRVWAIAVNALGEVFFLTDLPQQATNNVETGLEPEFIRDLSAWETGRTATWRLVLASQRTERFSRSEMNPTPSYYPQSVWNGEPISKDQLQESTREIESWLSKRPMDIKADFDGWDMRRRVECDFAADDGKGAGEAVFVFECGIEDDRPAAVHRYLRCALFKPERQTRSEETPSSQSQSMVRTASSSNLNQTSWSFSKDPSTLTTTLAATQHLPHKSVSEHEAGIFLETQTEWRCSKLSLGRYKNVRISTTAMDNSMYAVTTCAEDLKLRRARASNAPNKDRSLPVLDDSSPFKVPGQRSRFIAAGTSSGTIFIWDARSPPPAATSFINTIKLVRVIHTDSPGISALALSALYLVHGGSEGLVQAWDVLASTLEPLRTISSRNTLNARRRAVIAAQQNPTIQVQMSITNYAATAVCLDPDPVVLRGIVAIGTHLRYWSYSSAAVAEDLSKSQKRRMNRAARGLNSSNGDSFIGTRRVSLKGFVNREVAQRAIDEKEKRAEKREERRLAGRFGLDLLGHDASEEELVAYAKLLSEEDHEKHVMRTTEGRLSRNASDAEIEAFLNGLSHEDRERWRYASWEERFDIPTSDASTVTRGTPVSTPARDDSHGDVDMELAKAIRLSLEDENPASAKSPSPSPSPSPRRSPPQMGSSSGNRWDERQSSAADDDDDMAEAIRLSLQEEAIKTQSQPHRRAFVNTSSPVVEDDAEVEDDVAKAIRLSLQDQERTNSGVGLKSPDHPAAIVRLQEEEDFPILGSPSSGAGSLSPSGVRRKGKGKGKGPAAWG